jgi:hypothetical protein
LAPSSGRSLARIFDEGGLDHVAVGQLDGGAGVVGADHHLVQLLARTDADDLDAGRSGDMAFTRSGMVMDGIFGTKISPPRIRSSDDSTNSRPRSG